MRISFRKAALVLATAGLLASALPANAASTAWKDPEGDATNYLDLGPPRPSEPAYDVLDATLTSDGKDLTLAARFKKLGKIPPQATGNTYRFSFLAGEVGPGDVCISMGCGDIATLPEEVMARRESRRRAEQLPPPVDR